MILYLTTSDHNNALDFLRQHESHNNLSKMTGTFHLNYFVVRDMRSFMHCEEIIIDRQCCDDTNDDFVKSLEEFMTMYDTRITVICAGLPQEDWLFQNLLKIGVGNIVTASVLEDIQEEVLDCLSEQGLQKYNACERANARKMGEHYNFNCTNVKIGVFGSQKRIGTTTMALGLANWLNKVGATVCYVTNNNEMLQPIAMEYGADWTGGNFIANRITFAAEQVNDNYNFIIYDNGVDLDKVNDADEIVLLYGTKTYEIPFVMRAKQFLNNKRVFVCSVFSDKDIQELFAENNYTNLSMEYQPSLLDTDTNRKIYKKIIEQHIATV